VTERKYRIVVTDAQVEAAQMIIERDQAAGRVTPEEIRKIAAAEPPGDEDDDVTSAPVVTVRREDYGAPQ
jgi:hypothetical protein